MRKLLQEHQLYAMPKSQLVNHIKLLGSFFGDKLATELNGHGILAYIKHRACGLYDRELQTLSQAYELGCSQGIISVRLTDLDRFYRAAR